jgi:hypothetical protein
VVAPDLEPLAYGAAYAHAEDNVCQTAEHLVTVRGERALWFGVGSASGLLGLRVLPNEQVDAYVAAAVDDAQLEQLWRRDPASPVPDVTPFDRISTAVRRDGAPDAAMTHLCSLAAMTHLCSLAAMTHPPGLAVREDRSRQVWDRIR